MTRLTSGLIIGAASIALLGCESKSGPGGPGAAKKPGSTTTQAVAPKETFKLSVPSTKTDLDRGEQEEVTISIDRGSDFNQKVTLEFTAPQGVTVKPVEAQIPPGENKAKVM